MNKLQTILNGANNSITELFEWDPTEPVATRPMFMQYRVPGQTYALFYTHDGNKNVSEVVHFSRANGVAAHYEYAPFGEVTAQVLQGGVTAYDFAAINPWRFSSECADDTSATVYYNYRHYEPMMGRWLSRDPMLELSYWRLRDLYMSRTDDALEKSLYLFVMNSSWTKIDIGGLFPSGKSDGWGSGETSKGNCWRYACNDPAKEDEPHSPNPPGERDGPFRFEVLRFTCDSIKEGLLTKYRGKASVVTRDQECAKCHYKVLLVLRPESLSKHEPRDYHWYRQDTDDKCNPVGTWSHKPGFTPVQTDVIDPIEDAIKRHYGVQCPFFFCFPCAKNGAPSLDAD